MPRRGWTVWTEEPPAGVLLDMLLESSTQMVGHLVAIAAGTAAALAPARLPGAIRW
ncbi:hypothetical protein [Streptomyces sp. NPDC019507]|uniref:hypothetical protein n=1 Tax=Streptomyces sp. NPDC019507 TaxID=3154689 RepID=UPI0033DFC354